MVKEIFDVFLSFRRREDVKADENSEFKEEFLWSSKEGLKFLKSMFRLIKREMSEFSHMMNIEADSDFEKHSAFISKEFQDKVGLHEKICRKIEKLRNFNFNNGVSPINSNNILESLKKIRLERINF